MNEKIYKTMKSAASGNIILGIIILIMGIGSAVGGVLTIINGTKLNKRKSDILF
jgi:hypothetical protein